LSRPGVGFDLDDHGRAGGGAAGWGAADRVWRYLIAYWLPALAGGSAPAPGADALTEAASAGLTAFLESHLGLVAVVAVVLLVAGTATVALRRHHRPSRTGDEDPSA
jgi:hypothetical protein